MILGIRIVVLPLWIDAYCRFKIQKITVRDFLRCSQWVQVESASKYCILWVLFKDISPAKHPPFKVLVLECNTTFFSWSYSVNWKKTWCLLKCTVMHWLVQGVHNLQEIIVIFCKGELSQTKMVHSCFVHYFKITNIFFKRIISIMNQSVWETKLLLKF